MLFSGCAADRAVVKPWEYAPSSSSKLWNIQPVAEVSQKEAGKIASRLLPVTLPDQKEPLTLGELIDLGLQNNYSTKETWAAARMAAAQYAQSQQNFFPLATGSYNLERSRFLGGAFVTSQTIDPTPGGATTVTAGGVSPSGKILYLTQWGPQLSLSYLIFDFGQTRASSQSALQALYQANLTHNREVQTVIQTITTDYYNYLYQQKLLEAYAQDVTDAQTTLDAASLSLKAGVKNLSDVLQAKSQLLQHQTQLVNQRQAVQEAAAQLLTNLGMPAHIQLNLEKMPEHPRVFEIMSSVNELIILALEERGDLLAAEANFRSTEKNLSAARRAMLPTISGGFNIGKANFRGTGISGTITDHYDFNGQLTFSWSLFNGFYNLSTVRLAEANRDYSRAKKKQTELQVTQDITNSHSNVAVSREALHYTQDFLKTAEQEYDVALAQYKAGTADILRVISAQTSLATARAQRANALQNWFVSLSTLAYAAGVIQRDPRSFLQETSQ